MLSSHDAELVRRDTAIPGLATLLDPEAFCQATRSATGMTITSASPSYIRYKPGMNCLVAYQLDVDGEQVALYAKGHRADASEQLRKAHDLPGVPGALGPGRLVIRDQAIVLSIFPNDGELKTLARLGEPETRGALLRRILSNQPDLWGGTVSHIRYKPERRYVTQVLVENTPRAVLKVYTSNGYAEAKTNAKAFKSRGILKVPKRIGHSDRHQVLAFEWKQGQLLSEAMSDPNLNSSALERVGMALAEVHAGHPARLAHLSREAEASGLLSVAAGLGFLCPQLEERVQRLARDLALTLMRVPAMNTSIHGDFYAKQVLLQDGVGGSAQVVILDYDSASAGDPAADLGLFIAHLERGALRRDVPSEKIRPYSEALLDGYAKATGSAPVDRVKLYTAASLLRLSPHPFRNRHPEWPRQIEATVTRAEEIYKEGAGQSFNVPAISLGGRTIGSTSVDEKTRTLTSSATSDPAMPFIAQALDPFDVQLQFRRRLAHWLGANAAFDMAGIRVVRHKRGRRCLVEYELLVEKPGEPHQVISLLGKARARGLDHRTFETLRALYGTGFGPDADDTISVPQPVGIVPEFQMWLHRKVPGSAATAMLVEHDGVLLAQRIAEATYKLHSTRIKTTRRHTVVDELTILHEKLPLVTQKKPQWALRIQRLLKACDKLAGSLPIVTPQGIHRDFYADHVLMDGNRIYLLDFDLYCLGDPALDIGNFVGHMREWALRKRGNLYALADREEALTRRYLELSGQRHTHSIEIYTLLTLVRHIYLSTQFADRQDITEALLDVCEEEQARLLKPAQRSGASHVETIGIPRF